MRSARVLVPPRVLGEEAARIQAPVWRLVPGEEAARIQALAPGLVLVVKPQPPLAVPPESLEVEFLQALQLPPRVPQRARVPPAR